MKITRKALHQILCEIFPKAEKPILGDQEEFALNKDPERDEIASIYSDVYKDKYGVRPRHIEWDTYSADELTTMLDRLYDERGYDDEGYLPIEPEFPDMEGTVSAEETPASVRSGGFVRDLGDESPPNFVRRPGTRVSKATKRAERNALSQGRTTWDEYGVNVAARKANR